MNQTLTAADIMIPGTLFHRVFHSSPVGMVIIDAADGTYIDINDAFAQMAGYTRAELIGRPFGTIGLDMVIEREAVLDIMRLAPRLANIPFNFVSRDGRPRVCVASIQQEKAGDQAYFFVMVQDLTEQEQVRHALQHSENRFKLFFRNLPLPLLVIDEASGKVLEVNPAACRLYGYTQNEFTAIRFDDLTYPTPTSRPGGDSPAVTRQLLKNGTIIEVNIISFSIDLEGRRVRLAVVEDVTEQHAMQAELEASEERLRIIAGMTADTMWDYNLQTGEVKWSDRFSALFTDKDDDGMKRDWWPRHIHPDDRQALEESIRNALNSGENSWSAEYRYRRNDGVYASVLNNGYIARDTDGRPVRFMGSIIDLTRPLELAEVAARAALEERQRLAHNLHDSVAQSLYSVGLLAEATHRQTESGDPSAAIDYFDRLSELTGQALRQMRLLVYELRPGMLEQEGLAGALRHRLEAVEHRAGVNGRLIDDTTDPIPPHLQSDLFWIGQEALNNSLRHATATSVSVRLRSDKDMIVMEISDDGRLRDAARQDDAGEPAEIRRRVAGMGGELVINTRPDVGTTLSVRVPRGNDRPAAPSLRDRSAGL